jgi:hypothetical protein
MADQKTKQEVFRLLAGTGAKMVVAKNPPPSARKEGWIPLGETSFYAYPLVPTAGSSVSPASGAQGKEIVELWLKIATSAGKEFLAIQNVS